MPNHLHQPSAYRLPHQHDPYMPEGPDDSREKTPDEKCKMFTEFVQPKALRFPPYVHQGYPKWIGDGDRRQLVSSEEEHRGVEARWEEEDARKARAQKAVAKKADKPDPVTV